MTSRDRTGHNASDLGSVESWLVSAGRDRRPGSPLNVPPCPASNFVLGERRAYSRDDGTPSWEALEEIVGGLEGGSSVAFASGMAGIAAVFDQTATPRVAPAHEGPIGAGPTYRRRPSSSTSVVEENAQAVGRRRRRWRRLEVAQPPRRPAHFQR